MSKNKKEKYQFIKFGVSEFKRDNMKEQFVYITSFFSLHGSKVYEEEYIVNEFKKAEIYKPKHKKEENAKREMSWFRRSGYIDYKTTKNSEEKTCYDVKVNEITTKWGNGETLDNFHGITKDDFSFFVFLLKSKFKNGFKKESAFLFVFKYLIKNNWIIDENILISDEYKKYIEKIINTNNENEIYDLVKYKSGSTDKSKNPYFDETLKNYCSWMVDFNNLNKKDKFIELLKKHITSEKSDEKEGFFQLFMYENIDENLTLKFVRKELEKDSSFIEKKLEISSEKNLNERILKRLLNGVKNDYLFLIEKFLSGLSIFWNIDKDKKLEVNKKFIPTLNKILSKEETINNLIENKYYSPEDIIELFDLNTETKLEEESNYEFFSYFNEEWLTNTWNQLHECYSLKNSFAKINDLKFNEFIRRDDILKTLNPLAFPTFFEYLVGISFIFKIYKSVTPEKIKKHLNLRLDSSFRPIRFASGGKPDAQFVFSDYLITLEPTTQLTRQSQMEYDPTVDHIKKIKEENNNIFGFGLIISPFIEKKLIQACHGINSDKEEGIKLVTLDIPSLIKLLTDSNEIKTLLESFNNFELLTK